MNNQSLVSLRSMAKRSVAWAGRVTGRDLARLEGRVVILAYHRVLNGSDLAEEYVQPGMYVSRSTFEKHLIFLGRHFRVLSLAELLDSWDSGGLEPRQRYCVVTFDDGWADNYFHAFPLLKKYGIPATIFLTTSLIGTENTFWPEKVGHLLSQPVCAPPIMAETESARSILGAALAVPTAERSVLMIDTVIERLKKFTQDEICAALERVAAAAGIAFPKRRALLTWEEVQEMGANGLSFGSHGCSHRLLTGIPHEVERELRDALTAIRERVDNHIDVLAYPNGDTSADVERLARKVGYRAALGTRFGSEGSRPENVFHLHRVCLHEDVSSTVPLFAFRLSGLGTPRR